MRTGLFLTRSSLQLQWNFGNVAPYKKMRHYKALLHKFVDGQAAIRSRALPLTDARNFTIRWQPWRPLLTPLAGVEKRTLSGFDVRLMALKNPSTIKRLRQNLIPKLLKGLSITKTKTMGIALAPTLSYNGWGQKSSNALGFLKFQSFKSFKKYAPIGGALHSQFLMSWNQCVIDSANLTEAGEDAALLGAIGTATNLFTELTTTYVPEYDLFESPNLNVDSVVHIAFDECSRAMDKYTDWAVKQPSQLLVLVNMLHRQRVKKILFKLLLVKL